MAKEEVKEAKVVVNQNVSVKKSNGMAIAGFVISIVSSVLCCGIFNWLSLIFSIIGLVKSKEQDGEGKGLAIAGIVISAVLLVIYLLWMIVFGGLAFVEGLTEGYTGTTY